MRSQKSLHDSIASAANYIKKIGWKSQTPCFYQVETIKKIPSKYINTSARKIKNPLTIKNWKKKGIINLDKFETKENIKASLILPDGNANSPKYLVFDNYEKILKWNRSLRFGISVCTLANMIKNEI